MELTIMRIGPLNKYKVFRIITLDLRKVKELKIKDKIAATSSLDGSIEKRILTETLPTTFDWRYRTTMTDVKTEGYCGASYSFSSAAFFEQ